MLIQNLSKRAKLIRHSNAVVAGTADIEPAAGVDMQGHSGVLFVVAFGVITAGAVTSIKAQQSTVVDGSGDTFADLEGTAVAIADDDDNQLAYIDVKHPQERFVRCVVDRGTQNAVVDGIFAFVYDADVEPVTHDATVVGGELHVAPAEGTA